MKCILLCAGYATRLFPLTENFPKALLNIGDRPLLDYILDEVNSLEQVDSIYVVTNAKYTPHFEAWAKEKNNIKPITVLNDGTSTNDDRLGAIGDIEFTIENGKIDDDTLVIAGDNLFTFKLKDFVEFQQSKNTSAICVKKEKYETLKRLGVVETNDEMKIVGFEEKPADPKGNYAATAVYLYQKADIPMFKQYIAEGNNIDAPGNFVAYLYKKKDVYGYAFDGAWYDVGTHEALAMVNELYKNK
ncbi:MAG: nucleotidyltransferase family protein [Clostridia bacterium]|nr:nucleotidyltransferase family protein [Clostridia bacterium]